MTARTRTLWGSALLLGVCLVPVQAQRGEFVQTPWPRNELPAPGRSTIQGRVQAIGNDADACCASIASTPAAIREDALMAACRKAFGRAAFAVKGSTSIDLHACRAELAPADAVARYQCTAPLVGRCVPGS